jgi:hypothetical protein
MLRFIVLLLLVANGVFYAWSNGYLSQWGWAAKSQRETFRLNEQIEPDRIVVRQNDKLTQTKPDALPTVVKTLTSANTPSPSASTSNAPAPLVPTTTAAATTSTICLTAGAFNDRQSSAIKQALDSKLPNVRWRFETINLPARWIVYMGKYPNNNAREQKKSQLDQINVPYELLTESKLEPGLSLGSHATQALANQALQKLVKLGVRTARVLQELPEQKGQTLVVPSLDEANRAKLNTLYANLSSQLAGKPLQPCQN